MAQWLACLASNHRLSPLCGFDSHEGNAEDLSQYDPSCGTGCKTPTLTLITVEIQNKSGCSHLFIIV